MIERRQRSQPGFAYQYFLFSAGRLDVPELAVVAGIVAQNEGKLAVVGTPLQGFGGAPGDPAFRENLFNRRNLRRNLGCQAGGK